MEKIIDLFFIINLLLISYTDYKSCEIPDALNLFILLLKGIKIFFFNYSFENSIIGFGVYPIILLVIYGYVSNIVGKELIGFGDVKLLSSIGFYIGYSSLFAVVYYYNIICLVGIVLCYVILKIVKKKEIRGIQIPFAPIVCLALFVLEVLEVTK